MRYSSGPVGSQRSRKRLGGFSLVEVIIALGIVVFVLVALMGLLSSGLKVTRQAKTELEAAQVASSLIATRRAAPTSALGNASFPIGPLTNQTTAMQRVLVNRSGDRAANAADAYYELFYEVVNADDRVAQVYLALAHPPQPNADSAYTALANAEEGFEASTYVRIK